MNPRQYILWLLALVLFPVHVLSFASEDQKESLLMRKIAHELLIQLNDSNTRILPVKIVDNQLFIRFDDSLTFEPDLLMYATHEVLKEEAKERAYLIETKSCDSGLVVHSFKYEPDVPQDLQCRHRALPIGCYTIQFTRLHDVPAAKASSFSKFWFLLLVPIGALLLYGFGRIRKSEKEPSDVYLLGDYAFDPKSMTLSIGDQLEHLSSKESELLLLLYSNMHKTVDREEILKVVWGNETGYEGRTVDVFVSKLRKRLSEDQNIKIVNVRGVGYRLNVS